MRREERERAKSIPATPRTLGKADFRLSAAEAVAIVGDVERATSHWRREAVGLGLPRQQADRMALAYETPERQTAKALPNSGLPHSPHGRHCL